MELAERPARKGTRSCAECRRRKLRCEWDTLDAKTCRRCGERGSICTAQTFYVKPADPHKLSSKQRIQLLESKVASLVKAVKPDARSSPGSSSALDTPSTHATGFSGGADDGSELDDDLSSDSESEAAATENKPSHLSALFENDWLSIDADHQEPQSQKHPKRSTNRYLAAARSALLKLVPSKDDVVTVISVGSDRSPLEAMESNFPEPWVVTTHEELINNYETLYDPATDAFSIAFWLSGLSKLAQQISSEPGTPEVLIFGGTRKAAYLAKLLGRVIESRILNHDELLGCPEGMGLATECIRLHLYRGNFQKCWLLLRRAIAMAELLGYPQVARSVQLDTQHSNARLIAREDVQLAKALLWESLLDLDKICGTLLNLPTGTLSYEPQMPRPLVVDGKVRNRAYLSRLADISVQTRYIDNGGKCTEFHAALYPTVLDLDKQLKDLTQQVPASWFSEPLSDFDPRHLILYWQAYVAMRIHLPFALERSLRTAYMYSQLATVVACKNLLARYLIIRKSLPAAFFLGQCLDLQAFTASVVLLLTSQKQHVLATTGIDTGAGECCDLVPATADLMAEKSHGVHGVANIGKVGASSIKALAGLLGVAPDADMTQEDLTIKVPMLGKIHIRRRKSPSTGDLLSPQSPPLVQPVFRSKQSGEGTAYQSLPNLGPQRDGDLLDNSAPTDWHERNEPFSWSLINNHDDPFQDALMTGIGSEDWIDAHF